MADQHQVEILREGVLVWNKWRESNPFEIVDLGGINFSQAQWGNADLHEAVLTRADLSEADLHDANLRDADLRSADLKRAHLAGIDLSRANLDGANLQGAKIFEANLRGAQLRNANLTGANLNSADLAEAHLGGAKLSRTSLVGARLYKADARAADFRWADISGAHISGADFRNAEFTPKGGPVAMGSFLDLVMTDGIQSAHFSDRFLSDYLTDAFEYAHQPDVPETRWGRYVESALEEIARLRRFSEKAMEGTPRCPRHHWIGGSLGIPTPKRDRPPDQ